MLENFNGGIFRIGYFNWWLVAVYIALVSIFLYGILRPRRKSEWKSAGAAQAWVIALYAEMYGTPLTAYFVMGWLGQSRQEAEKHSNGHLWPTIFGVDSPNIEYAQLFCTVLGQGLILIGALLAVFGWRQLYNAVRKDEMVETGLYKYVRHPQYTGFFLFLLGSIINWPTIATILTLPILWWIYLRLAKSEEQDAMETFGDSYREYMTRTGRFLPGIGKVNAATPSAS